jgi:acyl carrier protein
MAMQGDAIVKQIIAEKLGLDSKPLSENLSFKNDLNADSLDLYEIVWAVEKRFRLSIADEELEQLTTVGDLIEFVSERVRAA